MPYMEDKDKKIVINKTKFILETCSLLDVELEHEYVEEPLFHSIIINNRGDMASISAEHNIFEAAIYAPNWSESMTKWAIAEGFSDSQIKTQNLMHTASLGQVCKFFI